MSEHMGSKISYLLVGLGIGTVAGVFFAPKSGEDTRKHLSKKAEEAKKYAQHRARELRERAEDLVECGKQVAAEGKESVSEMVDVGRDAYRRLSKAL